MLTRSGRLALRNEWWPCFREFLAEGFLVLYTMGRGCYIRGSEAPVTLQLATTLNQRTHPPCDIAGDQK